MDRKDSMAWSEDEMNRRRRGTGEPESGGASTTITSTDPDSPPIEDAQPAGDDRDRTVETPEPSPGTSASPAGQPENEEAAVSAASPEPTSDLQRVIEDISDALQDLKTAVKETHPPREPATRPAEILPDFQDRHYRNLFDWAPEGFLVTDAEMIIQEGNRAVAAMLNVNQEFLRGKHLPRFFVEEDRAALQVTVIDLRRGGEKYNWELRLQPLDHEPWPVSINVRSHRNLREEPICMLWLLRDARERKAEEETLKSLLSQMKTSFHGLVEAFAEAVEIKDPMTAGHQWRVAQLVVAIGRDMGFSLHRLEGLRVMGLLHDIGKIVVPMEILSKPGMISTLESEIIKTHCQAGYDLLKGIKFPWPVQQAILQHHERLDGSGYPAGLTDADIILEARILGVADVVEAMVCPRPYGPAQGIDRALQEVSQQAGILYDPDVVNICLKLFVEKGFKFD
jgi:PAS domain S-box-containing protein